MEVFKQLNYRGYVFMVSNYGNVRYLFDSTKSRKLHTNSKGYISFTKYNKIFLVHRMVAMAFIPNPENKPQVNHKDGNKANNHVNNLEWMTKSENELHSTRVLNNRRNMKGFEENWKNSVSKKKVDLFNQIGCFIRTFESCVECAKFLKVTPSAINNHLKGKTKKVALHIVKYNLSL